MVTFKQRDGKLNFKTLCDMDTTPIINLYNWDGMGDILGKFVDISNGLHGSEPGLVYGKPNNTLRECENSPGVWIFDFSNNVTILMFSDGFRKNHYKGTSYEVVLDNNPKDKDLVDSLNVLMEDFLLKFKDQFPEEFNKLQSFKKMKIK